MKTSTGFGSGEATAADVRLLREAVGPEIGVKASGGIRTLADAIAMLEAGAGRIGAISGVGIVSGLPKWGDLLRAGWRPALLPGWPGRAQAARR